MALTEIPIELSSTPGIVDNSNATAITIDSSENVGIGTSSPSALLHVASTGSSNIKLEDTDNGFAATQLNIENGGRDFKITTPQDTIFVQGSTEAMRILDGGNVGIGASSPSFGLSVEKDNGSGYVALFRKSSSAPALTIQTTVAGITQIQGLNAGLSAVNDIAMQTSGGNMGIGMAPSKLLDLQATDNLALRFYNSTSFKAGLEVATTAGDMIATSAVDDLAIRSQSDILFSTGGNTERMRIDASGNLLVGTTDTLPGIGDTNAGVSMSAVNGIIISRANDAPINMSRNSSDGALTYFRKNGAIIGSIATLSSALTIGTGDTGVQFNADNNAVMPHNISTGANVDASIDLGYSSGGTNRRFKDLYLSGNAYVGNAVTSSTDGSSDLKLEGNQHIFRRGSAGSYAEQARINANGNFLIGTTSSSGDTANTKPVVAGNFTTKYGTTSIPSVNTWTTVHTFGSNQGNFMVSMRASGTGNIADNSVSIVAVNNTATTSTTLLAGSRVQIRIVGLTLQVLQTVFAGANINWSIMSIGN